MELCRQLSQRGDAVIATCRHASSELRALDVRVIEGIDVTDDASVRSLAETLRGERIDVLINNAGILSSESLDDLAYDRILDQFQVNALGPLRLTARLLPNLKQGSKVVIITSRMGSLDDNSSGGMYGYRMSKAAVNMAGVSLAHDLRKRGIAVALLHPGMVATDMTGRQGIPFPKAASGLIGRIDDLTLDETGRFWHAEGQTLPW